MIFFICCRTKLLEAEWRETNFSNNITLVLDSLYLSLCIELAFDGSREILIAIFGVAYVAGGLLAR